MADSLVKVNNSHFITSILNTREQEEGVLNPVVKLMELRDSDVDETAVIGGTERDKYGDDQSLNRGERVVAKLRTDHLKGEEKK